MLPVITRSANIKLFHPPPATISQKIKLFFRLINSRNFVHQVADLAVNRINRFLRLNAGRGHCGLGCCDHCAGSSTCELILFSVWREASAMHNPARDLRRQLTKRVAGIVESRSVDQSRHSPHHRGHLILNNHILPRPADFLSSQDAVRAHSRHDYPQNIRSACSCHRTK